MHPIFPIDTEHLNPTFGFASTTGLDLTRLRRSIANGCFQTLASFLPGAADAGTVRARALEVARRHHVGMAALAVRQDEPVTTTDEGDDTDAERRDDAVACPYFNVECPFAVPRRELFDGSGDMRAVHSACVRDETHDEAWRTLKERHKQASRHRASVD